MEKKNIVICCDGTSNEFGTKNTNVVHIFSTLVQDQQQVAYYHPGLGTMAAPGAWTKLSKWITKVLGLALGRGLEDDIREAYVFLMNQYEEGDDVYLFGFSRGAYTVRCLAAILHMFGLIRKGNEPLIAYAIQMMTKIDDDTFDVADRFKETFSRECPVKFVGVWDTVSSVGWFRNPVKIPYTAWNPDIEIGRHAQSIDERRAFFRQNSWRPKEGRPPGPRNVKQVWFAGVHCDVGGGYKNEESGLSKIALKWMLDEAREAKLRLDEQKVIAVLAEGHAPDPFGKMHNSLTWQWWIAELVPKPRINFFRYRVLPKDVTIHESVFQRMNNPAMKYHPNLPKDPKHEPPLMAQQAGTG